MIAVSMTEDQKWKARAGSVPISTPTPPQVLIPRGLKKKMKTQKIDLKIEKGRHTVRLWKAFLFSIC